MSHPEPFKSSITTKKDKGPSSDDWVIEPFRVSQEDISLAARTLCCLYKTNTKRASARGNGGGGGIPLKQLFQQNIMVYSVKGLAEINKQ